MKINSAEFLISNTNIDKCPLPNLPEYAFIGRSNVGKSSLINMLTSRVSLAKTSVKPGKTQLINHFIINKNWYLVDLPGYGYAEVPKALREQWEKFIRHYLLKRMNLMCVFVLIDIRHSPQKVDVDFMKWLGENEIPFVIVFTKKDKVKKTIFASNSKRYKEELLKTWEELPQLFFTSATLKTGQTELLDFIETTNKLFIKK
ncbi:MAG TPA: ribosome biogenesis GTP-binding protein YihA/YsxC [Bacteroidia bacterium]|nr:ribosome biogenesis GTP-binding protein YihA/YsxC [Bacteroidia bacterium]